MGLFFKKVRVVVDFICCCAVALFWLPGAVAMTLINRLVNGYWGRDRWMEVYESWKEGCNMVMRFLAS